MEEKRQRKVNNTPYRKSVIIFANRTPNTLATWKRRFHFQNESNAGFTSVLCLASRPHADVLKARHAFLPANVTSPKNVCESGYATREEFENAKITGQFGFVFWGNSVREIKLLLWHRHLWKAPLKCFSSALKHKATFSNFAALKSVCEKLLDPFSWRISVDGRPNRRNQAVFLNTSRV